MSSRGGQKRKGDRELEENKLEKKQNVKKQEAPPQPLRRSRRKAAKTDCWAQERALFRQLREQREALAKQEQKQKHIAELAVRERMAHEKTSPGALSRVEQLKQQKEWVLVSEWRSDAAYLDSEFRNWTDYVPSLELIQEHKKIRDATGIWICPTKYAKLERCPYAVVMRSRLDTHLQPHLPDPLVSIVLDYTVSKTSTREGFIFKLYQDLNQVELALYEKRLPSFFNFTMSYGMAFKDLMAAAARSAPGFPEELSPFLTACPPPLASNPEQKLTEARTQLKPLLKLLPYSYQLNTLLWMQDLEDEVSKGMGYEISNEDLRFDGAQSRLAFDHLHQHLSLLSDDLPRRKLATKGGILADEVGLGKTLTMLSLVVSRPSPQQRREARLVDEYHYATGATLVVCPSHLVQQWQAEVEKFCATPLKVLFISTAHQHEAVSYQDIIDADIVLLSVQIFQNVQWKSRELSSDPEEDAMLSFDRLHKDAELSEVLETRAPHMAHFRWHRLVLDEGHELMIDKRVRVMAQIDAIQSDYRWYMTGTPFPDAFLNVRGALRFLRLTLDGEDVMAREPVSDEEVLQQRAKEAERLLWGLDPDPPTYSYSYASKFQARGRPKSTELRSVLRSPLGYQLYEFVCERLFVRNTKESIGSDFKTPKWDEQVYYLEFSPAERALYDAVPVEEELRRRQLCCHLKVSDTERNILGDEERSLEETPMAMLWFNVKAYATGMRREHKLLRYSKYSQKQLAKLQKEEKKLEKKLTKAAAEAKATPDDAEKKEELGKKKDSMKFKRKAIRKCETRLRQTMRALEDMAVELNGLAVKIVRYQSAVLSSEADVATPEHCKLASCKRSLNSERIRIMPCGHMLCDYHSDKAMEKQRCLFCQVDFVEQKETKEAKEEVEEEAKEEEEEEEKEAEEEEEEKEAEEAKEGEEAEEAEKKEVVVFADGTCSADRHGFALNQDFEARERQLAEQKERQEQQQRQYQQRRLAKLTAIKTEEKKAESQAPKMLSPIRGLDEEDEDEKDEKDEKDEEDETDSDAEMMLKDEEELIGSDASSSSSSSSTSSSSSSVKQEKRKIKNKKKFEEQGEEDEDEAKMNAKMRGEMQKQLLYPGLAQLISRFGTKMAHLIVWLRRICAEDEGHRVIIFSQWQRMLHMIGDTLQENGIKVVFCQGNVNIRNKAIRSFYSQNDVRVIMLSLENAASGTNLTQASHIVLIDPVAGTREEARAVEGQAIGRAHRQGQSKQLVVARFIIKNTIEHELYRRNR